MIEQKTLKSMQSGEVAVIYREENGTFTTITKDGTLYPRKEGEAYAVVSYELDPMDPRDWDNADHIVTTHKKYAIGDATFGSGEEVIKEILFHASLEASAAKAPEEVKQRIMRRSLKLGENGLHTQYDFLKEIAFLNTIGRAAVLSLTDHSGLHLYMGMPRVAFDSGVVGVAFISTWAYKKCYQKKRADRGVMWSHINAAVQNLAAYIAGNIYEAVVYDESGEEIDTASGFCGEDGLATDYAKKALDSLALEHLKEKLSGSTTPTA
jgi:hypothetical protein